MSTIKESRAARAWLCRLATGFAAGADLVRFLCDDRRPGGAMRYEGEADADRLLGEWEEAGVVARGKLQPLTPEQQINARGVARLNHYGWAPGPAYRAPVEWVAPPEREDRPAWQRAIDEDRALPRGTYDPEGFLLVPCPGGGPTSSPVPEYWRDGGKGYCPTCSGRHPLRPDNRLPKHLTADLLAPRKGAEC